jgi:AcrR family transcriptional regulator
MAWDTEGTRRRLKEAATIEFAERGPDGTTMARIAERAGINKERLYKYFGDKQSLFEIVLSDELEKLAVSVGRPGALENIGEFAGRSFDYHASHRQLVRLLLWEGLAGNSIADRKNRTAHYQDKAQAYRDAQRNGTVEADFDADHLVFLIIALASSWFSMPQLALMLTGSDDSDQAEHARRRACVVRAAEQLVLPSPADRTNDRSKP